MEVLLPKMKKIMIVDDEILVRIGIKSILNWEEHGYTIIAEAQNGLEALEKIKENKPDIVLTDLMMDEMDGFDLIKVCSKEYPQIKFIVLSNYNDFDNVKKAMKIGAFDYIFKLTAKPDEILKILNELTNAYDDKKQGNNINSAGEDVSTKNTTEMKYRVIESIIHQSYISEEQIIKEFQALGLTTDLQKPYVVFYVSINDYFSVEFKENFIEINLLKFAMGNIIHEVISKNNQAEVYNYHNGELIVIINPRNNLSYDSLCKAIAEDFETISEYLKRYLGVGITASLGPMCIGIEKFSAAIKMNLQAISQKLVGGEGKLYIYDNNTRPEIIEVKKYILDNISRNLTISVAAKYTNMSESYFSHIFKKEVGMSFVDYVNKMRISKATELLENTGLQVNKIASLVGIDNANYFSVLFKKITGKSPYEYRSKIKEF